MKNSTDFVESLFNLYGLANSKPTANPGRRSTQMELASATPLDGHDHSNLRTPVGKFIFMALWRPDKFAIQQLSTQVLNPTTESKRAVKQLIRYLKGTQHTCLRLEPRGMVQKGLLELVGRGDSDWAGDSATRQSVTGRHCDVQNVTMCNRSLKQSAISLSSCEAEFYAASACAADLLGLAELCKELHCDVAVRLEMDADSAKTHSAAKRTRWTQTHRNTMLGNTTMGTSKASILVSSRHERQRCRSLHETPGWIANTVAREETWTSNPGWYEWNKWRRLRNGDD